MKLLEVIAGLKVVVIGEAMLDCYLQGFSNRLCQEAPVPVVTVTDHKRVPGGAANTAVNVHSLGGHVTFLSVIGDDWEGTLLQQSLQECGVSTAYVLTHPGRRTLAKQRVIAADQMLVRFDQGSTAAIDLETEQALIDQLENCFLDCDAVIVSDYGYGILTERIIQAIAKLQHLSPRTLVVDSKRLTAYRQVGATAVKPNYEEAIKLLGIETLPKTSPDCHTRAAQITLHGERLLDLTNAQIATVTLDVEGSLVFERVSEGAQIQSCRPHQPARSASHSQAIGAGDTFVSALTLALAAGAPTMTAADFASVAAAVVVAKEGTTACSAQELREFVGGESDLRWGGGELGPPSGDKGQMGRWEGGKMGNSGLPLGIRGKWGDGKMGRIQAGPQPSVSGFLTNDKYVPDSKELDALLAHYRTCGRRIVFTNGCFDILHSGHISYLNQARSLGDILVIGVNSDMSVSRLKGPSRPINPLEDRIQVLAGLGCVDHLVAFDDDTPLNLIQIVRPDIYVKGGDYTRETLPEAPVVEKLGGSVQILPFVENRSTTGMIKRICQGQMEE